MDELLNKKEEEILCLDFFSPSFRLVIRTKPLVSLCVAHNVPTYHSRLYKNHLGTITELVFLDYRGTTKKWYLKTFKRFRFVKFKNL